MRKILLGALALVTSAFFFGSAQADTALKIGGFFQQIVGMGDDTTGGITHEFDRINFSGVTTTDNGWEVGGTLQHLRTKTSNNWSSWHFICVCLTSGSAITKCVMPF